MDPGGFLEERVREGLLPGAVWAVARGDEILAAGAVGWSRLLPRRRRAHLDTVYDLASLTKPLATAALAVLLARDGLISLDEPLAERLPEMSPTPWAGATVLDLLVHRARLPAWEPLYMAGPDLPAYLRRLAALEPVPEAVLYSDLGYILAGVLLERAAGRSLSRLFSARVAGPLAGRVGPGPLPVRFLPPRSWAGRIAATEADDLCERRLAADRRGPEAAAAYPGWRRGIVHGEVHDRNAAVLGGVAGHAGLFGTVAGVAALARQFLPGSVLFDPPELTLFVTPRTPGPRRSVGFEIPQGPRSPIRGALSPRTFGHTGFTGASLYIDPDSGAICVLLTNRVHPRPAVTDMVPIRQGFHRAAARVLAARGVPPALES